jgi:copper chaperone CopZ
MTTTLRLKTNLNCGSCVAAVRPYLDAEPSISSWDVDVRDPGKTLTVQGDAVSAEHVKAAVTKAGFQVLGEVAASEPKPDSPTSFVVTYYPVLLLMGFLVVGSILAEVAAGGFIWGRAMRTFMGGFFLAFSFFKLLDLRGFADSYRMYDVVARRIPAYAYVYPFIELLLGAAYLSDFQPVATNIITLAVMSTGAIGVVQSLLAKRKIRCACLGTVFNLPMSTVAFIEDALMIAMAAAMLVAGVHSPNTPSSELIPHPPTGGQLMNPHNHARRGSPARATLSVQTETTREAGVPSTLRLMLRDANGSMVRDFDVIHEEKVHLIIVRDGLDIFAHVHPQVDADGMLTVPFTFPVGGAYRLFADFQPKGRDPATAATTLQVRGRTPSAPPLIPNVPGRVNAEGLEADVSVAWHAGSDREAMLRFELFDKNGQPLRDLKPYLGAMGHLVVIGSGDMEYVHAHASENLDGDSPSAVVFHAEFRKGGVYKGWAQFQRGDESEVVPIVLQVP